MIVRVKKNIKLKLIYIKIEFFFSNLNQINLFFD